MLLFKEGKMEYDLSWFKYLIFKLEKNGIGEYGVRQLSQCHWHNLRSLGLGNVGIIKELIQLEMEAASGWVSLNGNI